MNEENHILRCSTEAQRCESELSKGPTLDQKEEDDIEYEELPDSDDDEAFILLHSLMEDLCKATPEQLIKFKSIWGAL